MNNKLICLLIFVFQLNVYAQQESSEQTSMKYPMHFGFELAGLYIYQTDGGNTTTALPMLNLKFLEQSKFSLKAQAGATIYKDAATDKTFSIGLVHLNPSYKIMDSKISIEAILGLQKWDSLSAKSDFGARINYDMKNFDISFMDEIYLSSGIIQHSIDTRYVSLGILKWF